MTKLALAGQKIVVFDLEIKNEIGKNGVTWTTYDRMGISVGCTFDFSTQDYRVFMDDNLSDLTALLNSADMIVGFNIKGFDIPLLHATRENKLRLRPDLRIYDMLEHSRIAFSMDGGPTRPKGLRLDNHLAGTFGSDNMKTEDGANAPIFWQEGKLGRLISYCLADVKREAKLFKYVWQHEQYVTDTHGAKPLGSRHPSSILSADKVLSESGLLQPKESV